MNGPPWQPKGVGIGGECAPSHLKLKHKLKVQKPPEHHFMRPVDHDCTVLWIDARAILAELASS